MANILIGYANYTDASTLSGGSWNASYPLSNLKDSRLALVSRSADLVTSSTIIQIDLGASKPVRVMGLANHNLSLSATVAVQMATDAGFAGITYNSGALPAWPVGYDADAASYPRPTWGAAVNLTGRYFRFVIADPGNPAGFVQIGRTFIGNGFQPSINMEAGASLALETDTAVERSLSGAEFFQPRPLRRVMRFGIPALPNAEAFGSGFEVIRRSGTHREVFVIPDSADAPNRARRDFMGRLRQLSALEQPYGLESSLGFEVAELL